VLDGYAVGNIFASLGAKQMLEVTKAIDRGSGALYIYGNYSGEKLELKLLRDVPKTRKSCLVRGKIYRQERSRCSSGILLIKAYYEYLESKN